jgi:hypothetical protein
MQTQLTLLEAVPSFYAAKSHLLHDIPGVTLRDLGRLKCIHDDRPTSREVDTFYAAEMPPDQTVAAIRDSRPDPRHLLMVFATATATLMRSYGQLGYEPQGHVPVMYKDLAEDLSDFDTPNAPVCRVETASDLAFLNSRQQVMPEAHLNDPSLRCYYIEQDGLPVCWGTSVTATSDIVYLCGINTLTEYRRRGLAKTLLNGIHADAAQSGAKYGLLCATEMGYPLYLSMGYQVVATRQGLKPVGLLR